MKTRKILALVMAIALLAVSMTVVASATDEATTEATTEGTTAPVYAYNIDTPPTKLKYTDVESFDPSGLVISKDGTVISYDEESQYFSFDKTPLSVYTSEIEIKYKGESCGFIQIQVTHAGGEIVPVNNHSHGEICAGCGVICKNAKHKVPYWIPDGNASLLISETETGTCSICGDTVSRYISGTATYSDIFANYDLISGILSIINMIVEGFALI